VAVAIDRPAAASQNLKLARSVASKFAAFDMQQHRLIDANFPCIIFVRGFQQKHGLILTHGQFLSTKFRSVNQIQVGRKH